MMSSLLGIEAPPCNHSCGAEKDEAREIQNSLLPSGTLRNGFIEIAYGFSPFGEVGGDVADFFTLPNGTIALYIGDVGGQGYCGRDVCRAGDGNAARHYQNGRTNLTVLAILNRRLLVRPVQGRFATTLCAVYDRTARELAFSNAGMPYPLRASRLPAIERGRLAVRDVCEYLLRYPSRLSRAGRFSVVRYGRPSRIARR